MPNNEMFRRSIEKRGSGLWCHNPMVLMVSWYNGISLIYELLYQLFLEL